MYILLKVDSYNKIVTSNHLIFKANNLYLNYTKLTHEFNSPIKLTIKQNQRIYKLINKLFLNKSSNYLLDITCNGINIEINECLPTKISEVIEVFRVLNKRERKKLFLNKSLFGSTFESKLYGISSCFDNKYSHRITEKFENWFISCYGYYHETKENYFNLCEAALLAYCEFR